MAVDVLPAQLRAFVLACLHHLVHEQHVPLEQLARHHEHPLVRHWVRNLDSDPVAGFWLPTSTGRFYPDFVCELTDGRLFVAEYKGEHLRAVPKEIEKGQVGAVWAERSGGHAVFAMLFKQDRGRGLGAQLNDALA